MLLLLAAAGEGDQGAGQRAQGLAQRVRHQGGYKSDFLILTCATISFLKHCIALCQVIHLVRDPRAILTSRPKNHWRRELQVQCSTAQYSTVQYSAAGYWLHL